MSQPNQTSRNITPARPGSGCVPPSEITSSLIDDMLLGAWNSLPDAEPVPVLARPAPTSTAQQAISRSTPAPSADQAQRLVIPPIARPTPVKPAERDQAANRPVPRTIAPPTPVPALRSEPAKSYTPPPPSYTPPPASPPRQPVTFSRPRSSSSSLSLNMDEIRKWGTIVAGVVIASLVGYWGVSNVLGNSAPPMKTIAVKGTVMLNGKPAPGASVQLHPVEGSDAPIEVHPRGQVSESGQVEFTTFTPNDGIPAGEYIATISYMKAKIVNGETVAGTQLAPAIFTKSSTSPVRVKVSPETRELATLDFKKSAR